MINLIIFSKDRAMQLHGLLASLKTNCDIFDNIHIIIKWSDDDYKKAYLELAENSYIGNEFYWYEEGCEPFKEKILQLMLNKYTCFMVDDLIAYRKLKNQQDITGDTLLTVESNGIFSLRLGGNIRHCPEETFVESNDNEVGFTFDWSQYKKYWGYPFSVDGHVFRTDYIKPIIQRIKFNSPNKLEAHLQGYVPQAPKQMSCFNQSVVVSIPVNRVSNTATASYGEFFPHTAKELNDKFLAGERMDWEAMNFSDIKSPHQEVEFKFKTV